MHCLQYTSVIVDTLYVLSAGQNLRFVRHADLQLVSSALATARITAA